MKETIWESKIDSDSVVSYKKVDMSCFEKWIPDKYVNVVIDAYMEKTGRKPKDFKCMRVETLEYLPDGRVNVYYSIVDYYDFITTNMILFSENGSLTDPNQIITEKSMPAITKIVSAYSVFRLEDKKIKTIDDIFNIHYLANATTSSVMLEDVNGVLGVIQYKKNNIKVDSAMNVTLSTIVKDVDLKYDDPPMHAAFRALKEELNLDDVVLSFDGFVVSEFKMQPCFMYKGKLEKTWEEMMPTIVKAQDYDRAVGKIGACTRATYKILLSNDKVSPITKFGIKKYYEGIKTGFLSKIKKLIT